MADRRATRNERDAMQTALNVLRRAVLCPWSDDAARVASDVDDVLRIGGRETRIIRYHTPPLTRERIARLALYLRARLRMERGDFGPRTGECEACDGWGEVWHHGSWPPHELACTACDGRGLRGTITPIWQLAPAHEGAR